MDTQVFVFFLHFILRGGGFWQMVAERKGCDVWGSLRPPGLCVVGKVSEWAFSTFPLLRSPVVIISRLDSAKRRTLEFIWRGELDWTLFNTYILLCSFSSHSFLSLLKYWTKLKDSSLFLKEKKCQKKDRIRSLGLDGCEDRIQPNSSSFIVYTFIITLSTFFSLINLYLITIFEYRKRFWGNRMKNCETVWKYSMIYTQYFSELSFIFSIIHFWGVWWGRWICSVSSYLPCDEPHFGPHWHALNSLKILVFSSCFSS